MVWQEMAELQRLGMGEPVRVSELRDKFVLDVNHDRALALTNIPAADGFVRADTGSLLFRNASTRLRQSVPQDLASRAMASRKGLEFRWTQLNDADIKLLFALVVWIATSDREEMR